MGLVTMFNGIDILQMQDYVKISVQIYTERISEKYLALWMTMSHSSEYPNPLPHRPKMMQDILNAEGSPDTKLQDALAKKMGFGYRNGIGELIYAMITCHPDLSYSVVRCLQYSAKPHEIHYHAVRHMLTYLYQTRTNGMYYWCATPNMLLPKVPPYPE